MKLHLPHSLCLLVMLLCMLWHAEATGAREPIQSEQNRTIAIRGVFFQPWENPLRNRAYDFDTIFKKLHKAGINEVIIQWSQYGDTSFISYGLQHENLFDPLLRAARAHHIHLVFGLYKDPDYFSHLGSSAKQVAQMLQRIRERSVKLAGQLMSRYGEDSLIAGFYLPEEIDDQHWNKKSRRKLLHKHLRLTRNQLHKLAPDQPVFISGFYNGHISPANYARLWQNLITNIPVTLLIQTGTGANQIPVNQSLRYLEALHNTLESSRWGLIYEAFRSSNKNNKAFVPASPATVQHELQLYNRHLPGIFITLYSLKYLTADQHRLIKQISASGQ